MPAETIIVHKGHGLPYSKGLMAQALSAIALSQERSFELRPEPVEEVSADARVAVFTTGADEVHDIPDPVLVSANLARRGALAADLDRAAAERCDVYLTELKAAAIDTVALRARDEDVRVVFIRNRPTGIDDALVNLYRDAC